MKIEPPRGCFFVVERFLSISGEGQSDDGARHVRIKPTIHTGLHGFEDWSFKDISCSPYLDDSADLLLQIVRATFVCDGCGLGNDLGSSQYGQMRRVGRWQLTGANAIRKSSFPRAFDCCATSVVCIRFCRENEVEVFRTIGKVDQVESLGGRRVANPLQPDLCSPFSVSSV